VDIGKRVKTARNDAQLSQDALARRAGMSVSAVAQIEQGGRTDPHYSTLTKLADALNMSVGELLEEPALAGKAEAPREAGQSLLESLERVSLLEKVLHAARQDEEKTRKAVNRSVESGGVTAIASFKEDEVRAELRARGFPDEYFESFTWPLILEALQGRQLKPELARTEEEVIKSFYYMAPSETTGAVREREEDS